MTADAPIDSLDPEQLRQALRATQAEMALKEEVIQRQAREARSRAREHDLQLRHEPDPLGPPHRRAAAAPLDGARSNCLECRTGNKTESPDGYNLVEQRNKLGGQIAIEGFAAAFAAITTFLDATEGCLGQRQPNMVDRHHARLQSAREKMSVLQ